MNRSALNTFLCINVAGQQNWGLVMHALANDTYKYIADADMYA